MAAHFGWQGLSLQHPDDWAPVVLSGDRRSGYARLASPRALSLQIRWAPAGVESLDGALGRYLDRLSKDAQRKRQKFSREVHEEEALLRYRYRGETDGEGLLFPTEDGRIAFIEALGESTTARAKAVDRARASFATGGERWSVLGLDFRLPGVLRVEKREFLAGRTSLVLAGRGVQATAERWGLAESLLARMSLTEWVQGRLGRGWTIKEEGRGLVARRAVAVPSVGTRRSSDLVLGNASESQAASMRAPTEGTATRFAFLRSLEEAIALHQPEANQIVMIRVRSRDAAWRPQWDWLT